jgi:hypothetical protein
VVITVSGVPTGTKSLAVEVTVDTAVIKLQNPTNDLGALSLADSNSVGVAILSETDLPASFMLTVPLTAVAAGSSMFALGNVLNMLGGTALAGASATVDSSSVTVSAGGGTSGTSGTTGGTSGPGGMLSADTITITLTGQAVTQTDAVVATVGFGTADVAKLGTAKPTFMGTGASQLLTDVDTATGDLSAAWTGTITDEVAVLTAMLDPGSMAGTTTVLVSKVRAKGGTDITDSIVSSVSPSSVTNSAATVGGASFTFVGPDEVTGPGKAAFAFTVSGGSVSSATVNGAMVTFEGDVGIAIVTLPASGSLDLVVTAGSDMASIGSVTVNAGEGKAPKVANAKAKNKGEASTLVVTGKRLKDASVEIVPTDRDQASAKAKGARVNAKYSECIPNGSFVNVSTAGGTDAKKIKVKGGCDSDLVE